jgi:hypothetical protein
MITLIHDLTDEELEAAKVRVREAFERAGKAFDESAACFTRGVLAANGASEALTRWSQP